MRIQIHRRGQKKRRADHDGKTDPPTEEKAMNALTKWNPFRELEEMQNRLSSLFGRTPVRGPGEEAMTVSEWTPLVDITEDDKEYLIKAELPEVKKEDVKVTVENGTVDNHRRTQVREGGEGQEVSSHRARLRLVHAEFYPSEGAAGDKTTADFKDGVLKVHLPKSAEAKPKSIDVKVG